MRAQQTWMSADMQELFKKNPGEVKKTKTVALEEERVEEPRREEEGFSAQRQTGNKERSTAELEMERRSRGRKRRGKYNISEKRENG